MTTVARGGIPGGIVAASAVLVLAGLAGSVFVLAVWHGFGIHRGEALEAAAWVAAPALVAVLFAMAAVSLARRGRSELATAVLLPPLALVLAALAWVAIA